MMEDKGMPSISSSYGNVIESQKETGVGTIDSVKRVTLVTCYLQQDSIKIIKDFHQKLICILKI